MSEITISLAQSPTAPTADFLCKTLPHPTSSSSSSHDTDHSENLPPSLRLDSYTRAPYSRPPPKPTPSLPHEWHTLWLRSTDGRGKLPGFLGFLKGRKKSALGRFESPVMDEDTGGVVEAVFVVPYDQPRVPQGEEGEGKGDLVFVRYCLDGRGLKEEVAVAPVVGKSQRGMQPPRQRNTSTPNTSTNSTNGTKPKKKSSTPAPQKGLFSRMVLSATLKQKNTPHSTHPRHRPGPTPSPTTPTHTAGHIISQIRTLLQTSLTTFLQSPTETSIKIPVSLAAHTKDLSDEEKEKVGMEVVKFLVSEQVDEIGEEEGWVSMREPGEFADEAVFAVYKKGAVPVDIMEDMMKGDMPDEAKNEARAQQEAKTRENERKARKEANSNLRAAMRNQAHAGEHTKSLNHSKRDRRSIEDIQRDMGSDGKRARGPEEYRGYSEGYGE